MLSVPKRANDALNLDMLQGFDEDIKFQGEVLLQDSFQVRYNIDKNTAMVVGGLKFDSGHDQIRHSVANGSLPLRCFFGAVLLRR